MLALEHDQAGIGGCVHVLELQGDGGCKVCVLLSAAQEAGMVARSKVIEARTQKKFAILNGPARRGWCTQSLPLGFEGALVEIILPEK